MENKDNNTQENWQQVLQEFAGEEDGNAQQQAQSFAQQPQPQQFAQQAQQFSQQAQQYAQQQQQQQQYAQQTQPYAQQQQQYAQQTQQYAQQQQQYAQPQQYTQQYQPTAIPAYDASSFAVMPVKKKSKTPIIILIIVLAAALIGGGIFLLFQLLGGKGGYENLERKFFGGLGETISDTTADFTSDKIGEQFELSLTPGTDEFAPTVISGKTYADLDSGKMYYEFDLKAGDQKYLSAKVWQEGEQMIMQIPELSDIYITMDASEATSLVSLSSAVSNPAGAVLLYDSYDYDDYYSSVGSAYNMGVQIGEMLAELSPEQLESLVNIITDAYFECFTGEDVKSATLTAGSATVSCKSYTVKFTMGNIYDFIIKVIEKISDDKTFSALMEENGIDKSTLNMVKSMFESAKKESTKDELNEEFLRMVVYYDNDEIIGRSFVIDGEEILKIVHIINDDMISIALTVENEVDFSFNAVKSGDKYDVTASLYADGETLFSGSGSFTVTDTTFSGSADITIDGETASFDISSSENGSSSQFGIGMTANGEKIFDASVSASSIPYEEISVPEVNSSNSVDMGNSYNYTDAYEKFYEDVANNAEKITETINSISKPDIISAYIAASLYSTSYDYNYDYDYGWNDYDWDYDYDYDYDFDWDDYDYDYDFDWDSYWDDYFDL